MGVSRAGAGWFGSLLVCAALLSIAACGSDSGAADAPAVERSLFGSVWWIGSAAVDGVPVTIEDSQAARVRWEFLEGGGCDGYPDCPDGPKLVGNDGCNDFAQSVTIEQATVRRTDWGYSTAMACVSPFGDAMNKVMWGDGFEYSIVGDLLTITSLPAGVVLTFWASDQPFGPAAGQIVDEGSRGGVAYRLVWSGALTLEFVDPAGGPRPSTMSVGPDPSRVNGVRGDVADGSYLLAILPTGAVSAVYEPAGAPPIELTVTSVANPAGIVVGQFVDPAPDEWSIVAYDAAGTELNRLSWLTPTATTVTSGSVAPVPAPPESSCTEVPVGVPTVCAIGTHCGVTMFSTQVNGQWWKSQEGADGPGDYIPPEWGTYTDPPTEVTIVVTEGDEPTLTASLNGHDVVYHPIPQSEVDWCA